jgi:hypothetical protein
MKVRKAFCLFEQSGTFKNEFKKFGIDAEDFDIQDEFGQTDHVIDLFSEIEKGYQGARSIFDDITPDDLIVAFFPCTRFEAMIDMAYRGNMNQQQNWTDLQKIEYAIKLHNELHELYILICKLFAICLRGGQRMIVENPAQQPHYLTRYFPIKPKVIDPNRRDNGDYFNKPTQYWFVNCDPEQNVCFFPVLPVKKISVEWCYDDDHNDIAENRKTLRSMMHPQYAYRFIAQYIIECDGKIFTKEYVNG